MAGKLTIRRVGSFLPHICLVALLVTVGIIIWLSTVGIPDCAVRRIEAEASKAGIPLRISKIKLIPRAGLAIKAENIGLSIPQPDAPDANLQIRKVQLAFSLMRLLGGDITPQALRIKGGIVKLPTGPEEKDTLTLDNIDVDASFPNRLKGLNARINAYLSGIELDTQLVHIRQEQTQQITEQPQTEKKALVDLNQIGKQLESIRPTLQQVQKALAVQTWTPELHPILKFKIFRGEKEKSQLSAWIPSFNYQCLHARDINLEALYESNTFTINALKLNTVDPDTSVSIQGAYNTTTRELDFNTHSSAPLVKLLDSYLGDTSLPILKEIESGTKSTPLIELSGSAAFTEDYALNRITLRGKVEQKAIVIGNTHVDHLLLTFYVRNGSINVDNIVLKLPEGHLRAAVHSENGIGSAKIDIDLSDETCLTLIRDVTHNPDFEFPEGLSFKDNLKLRASCVVASPVFEPGKTRLEDLIPSLKSCEIQFNTNHIKWKDIDVNGTALSLRLDEIELGSNPISIGKLKISGLTKNASSSPLELSAKDVVYDIELERLLLGADFDSLSIGNTNAQLSLAEGAMGDKTIKRLYTTAGFADFHTNWKGGLNALSSNQITAKLQVEAAAHAQAQAKEIHLDMTIPEGLRYTDGWKNMQNDAKLLMTVNEIRHNDSFCMTGTQIKVSHTGDDECRLNISSSVGNEPLAISCTAALEQNHYLQLKNLDARVPLAAIGTIMAEAPLKEIKLPRLITLQGDALIDTRTYRLIKSHYNIHIPELVRVCHNIKAYKGREIPLNFQIDGDFSTAEDGTMDYSADVKVSHSTGSLDVHVKGNPLKECHITGTNSITVDIVNALIDNDDAHWIMRNFRCTPGVTKHNIRDIEATLRYDKGFYLHALCKAQVLNLEFLLSAIQDRYDNKGKATGEEYLRTDFGKNPYTLVREAKCDVEVIVQLDCCDEAGTPLPERLRINLTNPELLYDNKPWLKRNGFKNGPPFSRISGEAVRFNIENNTISLHNLKGNCYPAYSIGMYYAPIQYFLRDIILKDPVDIATDYCIFPLSRNCSVPMRGLIQVYGATGAGFRFLGTTIPFSHFTGFINISNTDVYLDQMNGQCWGGVMNGVLRIGFGGQHTSLDGYVEAHNVNLQDIAKSYNANLSPAICNGNIRFQATKPELEDIIAYGEISLKDGDLMQLSLFRPIASLLSDMPGHLSKLQKNITFFQEAAEPTWADKLVSFLFDTGSNTVDSVQESSHSMPFANHFLSYGIDKAFTRFDIKNGHFITRGMKAKGYNLSVDTQLDIDIDKLTLEGDLWPRISSVPTVLISPITIFSKFLIDINLQGNILDPQWEIGLSKKLRLEDTSLSPEPQKDNSLQVD